MGLVVLLALGCLGGVAVPLLGPSLALHGTGEAAPPGVGVIAALRAALFAALCVPVGEAFAGWLTRRTPEAPVGRMPATRVAGAAGAGFVAALGLAAVVSTGNLMPHRLSDVDITGLYRTRDGVLALIELNGFLLAGLWARQEHAGHAGGTGHTTRRALPPVAIIAAEAFRAHPGIESAPLFGAVLTTVHLTCAALWVGGLWQVLRIVRLWRAPPAGSGGPRAQGPAQAAVLMARYARVAAVLLAVLAATGTVSAVRRMPLDTVLGQLVTTAYGRTLVVKVLLVAVAAALALAARLRLGAGPLRAWPGGPSRARPSPLRRPRADSARDPLGACAPARSEVAVLGAVVAVSALLTALPVPIWWR